MKTIFYVNEANNLEWVLECVELVREKSAQSRRRNGVTFYLDENGVYCYFDHYLVKSPPALKSVKIDAVVIIDHIEGARHVVEGIYDRKDARAVVDSFVDNHGYPVADVRITGCTLADANRLYIDLRQANVPVGVAWNPPPLKA